MLIWHLIPSSFTLTWQKTTHTELKTRQVGSRSFLLHKRVTYYHLDAAAAAVVWTALACGFITCALVTESWSWSDSVELPGQIYNAFSSDCNGAKCYQSGHRIVLLHSLRPGKERMLPVDRWRGHVADVIVKRDTQEKKTVTSRRFFSLRQAPCLHKTFLS